MNVKILKDYIIKNFIISNEYLDNYHVKNYNNIFIILYDNIQRTKMYIWSHFLVFIGWSYLPYILSKYFNQTQLSSNNEYDLGFSIPFLSFFLLFYLEEIFFPNFRIRLKFIYQNKIYLIFWNLGLILFLGVFFNLIGIL